uniref:Uncharacterized protein n=1 Tax=Fusarium oxysporum (strain Fo5176) TaxID=660025 RepID=A0A0D2Y6M1_FUSOF
MDVTGSMGLNSTRRCQQDMYGLYNGFGGDR